MTRLAASRRDAEPRTLDPPVADHVGSLLEQVTDGVQLGRSGGEPVLALETAPLRSPVTAPDARALLDGGDEGAHEHLLGR